MPQFLYAQSIVVNVDAAGALKRGSDAVVTHKRTKAPVFQGATAVL